MIPDQVSFSELGEETLLEFLLLALMFKCDKFDICMAKLGAFLLESQDPFYWDLPLIMDHAVHYATRTLYTSSIGSVPRPSDRGNFVAS